MKDNITTVGVNIGSKHTARDYGLILTTRPDTGSPKPKTYSQDIPGADGVLDLTEATTGEVKFSNRTVTIQAKIVLPYEEQEALKSQILGDCHGKKLKIILDEDIERYYYGRVSVTFPQKSHDQLYVTFTVDAEPYKMAVNETVLGVDMSAGAGSLQDNFISIANTSPTQNNAVFDIPADDPFRDFSDYQDIAVKFTGGYTWSYSYTPMFEIESGTTQDGNLRHWERYLTEAEKNAARVSVAVADLTAAGIDITNIRHIKTIGWGSENRDSVQLVGTAYWQQVAVHNGQKSVVPVILCDTPNAVDLQYGGRTYPLTDTENQFDELLFTGGRSQVNLKASSAAHVEIRFRRGWL